MKEFAMAHPFLTFFIVYAAIHTAMICWSRLFRHLNIRAQGWPPSHLDADGDFLKEKDDE
jgi:hypothetical protein